MSLLNACSQLPDAVNPEWYNSSVDFFAGSGDKMALPGKQKLRIRLRRTAAPPPGANKEFPKIAAADQQRDYSRGAGGSLVADTEGRKYAPAIARQGEPSGRLAAAPPPEPRVAEQQPAPPATPTPTVTMEQATLSPPSADRTTNVSLPSTDDQKASQARPRNGWTKSERAHNPLPNY